MPIQSSRVRLDRGPANEPLFAQLAQVVAHNTAHPRDQWLMLYAQVTLDETSADQAELGAIILPPGVGDAIGAVLRAHGPAIRALNGFTPAEPPAAGAEAA